MDKVTVFGTLLGFGALIVGLKLGGGTVLAFADISADMVQLDGAASHDMH